MLYFFRQQAESALHTQPLWSCQVCHSGTGSTYVSRTLHSRTSFGRSRKDGTCAASTKTDFTGAKPGRKVCLASMPLMTHRPKQAQSALYCKVLPIHHLHVGQSSMQHGFNISRIKGCDLYTSAERDCSAIMYNMVHNFVLGPASQAEASRGLTSQTACEPEIRGACQKGMAEMNLFPDVPVKCSSGSSALSSPLWCMHQGLPMLSHPPSADVLSRRPVLSCWPGGEGTHCPVALQS